MESSRWSSSYHKKSTNTNGGGGGGGGGRDHLLLQLPESPREPMEFLSRSWSASAIKVCKAVAPPPPPPPASTPASLLLPKSSFGNGNSTGSGGGIAAIPEKNGNEEEEEEEEAKAKISGNTFSFASSATSQLVLERIMAQSEVSPLTSGRLSHSSGPLNASCLAEDTDSPLNLSPNDEFEDVVKYLRVNNSLQPLFTTKWNGYTASGANTPGTKTVGRWLKERREKKKEETRTQDAQVHAAVTVAGLASAVAAIASATAAASSSTGKDKQMAKTDVAVASAATLVAAQCVEAAEAMGADREHLVSAISSAVNVHSHGDISTLTAAAATALRGVATLKARALKEVWNIATMIPVDKGLGGVPTGHAGGNECGPRGYVNSPALDDNFLGICNQELLGRGRELLKRTRNGDLHWKIVSVYIHRTGQVMLKMKSKHVGSTITKKKKNVVLKVCKDLPAWPGRHLFEDGEKRRYFGLQTDGRGLVEFECKNQKEYEIWTQGVSRLLSIVAERRQNNYKLK